MITKNKNNSTQVQIVSMEDMIPDDHLLKKIDQYIDFNFIYDLVEDKYSQEHGRPSLDPVMLIKIPIIQYMFGIRSMRQTIKEIEVNVAYRWFLGLGFYDKVPHFSTFGKNYKRRFEGTDLFEQIFQQILLQCMKTNAISTDILFVDATHVKACANRKKSKNVVVAKKQARFYEDALREEINNDRELHGKKPFEYEDDDEDSNADGKNIDDDNNTSDHSKADKNTKTKKVSETDPESGWFHKGEHKEVFAYAVEAACDKNGWTVGYTIHPGNEHDSTTFPTLYEKLKKLNPKQIVMDAGYKIPPIAKMLIDDGIEPIFPYKRPMTKEGFFNKREYVYDEFFDCYICPNNKILDYSTTNRDGYREYKSLACNCENCPYLSQCTESKNHVKVVTQHVWENYMEICEDIRHRNGTKAIYDLRKETIERIFGTAKENHGMRYTQEIGKEKMAMKVGLTFACLNMKKLVNLLDKRDRFTSDKMHFFILLRSFFDNLKINFNLQII